MRVSEYFSLEQRQDMCKSANSCQVFAIVEENGHEQSERTREPRFAKHGSTCSQFPIPASVQSRKPPMNLIRASHRIATVGGLIPQPEINAGRRSQAENLMGFLRPELHS